MKKILFGLALFVVCHIFFVPVVFAGGEGGDFKITSLRISGEGVLVRFDPAPSACNGGTLYRMHAIVGRDVSPNYKVLVSALLTAYTAGVHFRYIWYADLPTGTEQCGNNGEILELTYFELENK